MLSFRVAGGWKLNEAVGTTRTDVLGSLSMFEAGGTVLSAAGKFGRAASFVNDGHVFTNATRALVPSGSFTLACWVNWTSGGTTTGVCLRQSGASSKQYIQLNGSTGTFLFSVDGTGSSEGTAKSGVWTHVALAYDSTVPVFATYQDGLALASHNVAANFASPTGVLIGTGLNALVSEAYVWDRCLSASEIATLCGAGNAGLSYPWSDGKSLL